MKRLSEEGRFECGLDEVVKGKCWAFTCVLGEHYNFRLGVAIANEPGYYPVPEFWCHGDSYDEMHRHVDELNDKEGLTQDEAARIMCSSMVASRRENRSATS
jgi:hypothetical protein